MGNCFGSNVAEVGAVKAMAQAHHAHPQGTYVVPTNALQTHAKCLVRSLLLRLWSCCTWVTRSFACVRAVALAKHVVMSAAPSSAAQSHHAAARHQGVPVPVPGKLPPPATATATGGAGGSRPPAAAGGGSDRQPDGRILEAPNLRVFTFAELKAATRSFKPDTVLGEGGFGRVYKGWVDERTMNPTRSGIGMVVAVKKLNQESVQGLQEWQVRLLLLAT